MKKSVRDMYIGSETVWVCYQMSHVFHIRGVGGQIQHELYLYFGILRTLAMSLRAGFLLF